MVDDLNNKIYYSGLSVKNKILYVFSFLLFFLLTRQVPFDSFSSLMNLSLFGIILFSLPDLTLKIYKKQEIFVLILISFFVAHFFYSILLSNELSNVFRFLLIFIFLSISYYIVLPKKTLNVFLYLSIVQALLISIFSLILFLFFSVDNYLPIRAFFLERGWGDVYTFNGWFYKVQVKGNALLPVAFFITFFYEIGNKRLVRTILLIGCLFAGNTAYLISIIGFIGVYFLKTNSIQSLFNRVLLIILFVALTFIPVYNFYIKETIEQKSDSSLPARVEQVNLLMDDLSENNTYLLLGRGIGHTIEKITPSRDYRGNIYFELQTFYVLNQLGLFGFIMFLFYNVYMSIRLYSKWLILIYVSYIIYAFTNPYIFDTNHIVVILLLNTLQNNETE
jgi:hypothetical protein